MDINEDELRNQIVKILENSFVFRRPIDPHAIASDLATRVDLPVEDLAGRVATIAKSLGVRIKV